MSKSKSRKAELAPGQSAVALYMRLLRYAWRYKYVFLLSVVALVILSATNTGFLVTIKQVTDEGFVNKDASKLAWLPFMLFGLLALRAVSGFTSTFAMRWVARRIVENLRLDAFRNLMALPVSFYDANSAGVVTSTFITGSSSTGCASMKTFCSPMEAAIWKAMSDESTSWYEPS